MTIKTTGPLSLTDIVTEFGDTTPPAHGISEYYAGGANVPAGTIGFPGGVSTPIPTNGVISWSNFYGAMKQIGLGAALRFMTNRSLQRTPASASNRRKWTFSAFIKRGGLCNGGAAKIFLSTTGGNSSEEFVFGWHPSDALYIGLFNNDLCQTKAKYRDTSSWYHVVLTMDSDAGLVKIYVNGVEQELTNPTRSSGDYGLNRAVPHFIGVNAAGSLAGGRWSDNYMADINFIDGQALDPTAFAERDATNGMWKAKKYSGSYGTNGFHLDFSKGATPADYGKDSSGNGNDWNVNGHDASDWVKDVPTLSKEDTADYATWDPLFVPPEPSHRIGHISNGNLECVGDGGQDTSTMSTIGVSSGKYYAEFTLHNTGTSFDGIGIAYDLPNRCRNAGVYYRVDGARIVNGSSSGSSGRAVTGNDILGIAVDYDSNQISFYLNGNIQGSVITFTRPNDGFFSMYTTNAGSPLTAAANFGQQPFKYPPPAGFKPLNTFNLPEPAIKKPEEHFKVVTYTANGAAGHKINVGFQPDLIWIKNMNSNVSGIWSDSVRGPNAQLFTNIKGGEQNATDRITSFDSDGFTLGVDGGQGVNRSGQHVARCWKAGGAAVANTDGTLPSQVSVNKAAGFSIVKYQGNGVAGATVGHGLGVAPAFIIFKSRTGGTDWSIYNKNTGNTKYMSLQATNQGSTDNGFSNNTAPSATVFTLGNGFNNDTNGNMEYMAYCWAEIPGFSKFGTYTGNGAADGPFVNLGFKPAFIMLKSISNDNDWEIYENARSTYNPCIPSLYANNDSGEDRHGGDPRVDFVANGFKCRTGGAGVNGGGWKYIYMAFAEHPFKYASAR